MRYTFVRRKGNHGQIVIKESGWIADPPLEIVGGAGDKQGAFGKVLQFEERVVKSVRCFRGERDRLWVDGEEGLNFGGGRKKNCRDSSYAFQVKPMYTQYMCHSQGNTLRQIDVRQGENRDMKIIQSRW